MVFTLACKIEVAVICSTSRGKPLKAMVQFPPSVPPASAITEAITRAGPWPSGRVPVGLRCTRNTEKKLPWLF